KVQRAQLGVHIRTVPPDDPERAANSALGNRGAIRVLQVERGSAAEAGGLQANDLILTLAGQPVADIPSFAAAIAAGHGPTDLQILRDGELKTITVNLIAK